MPAPDFQPPATQSSRYQANARSVNVANYVGGAGITGIR